MDLIQNTNQLNNLISHYFKKETITNNYVLIDNYNQIINSQMLFYIQGNKNLYLLVNKTGFRQLYYYINDFNEYLPLESNLPIMMEILYRGEAEKPCEILDYWNVSGFKTHLSRDLMSAPLRKIVHPSHENLKVKIKYAKDSTEIEYVYKLIKDTFDLFTGDILTYDEVTAFADNEEILLAKIGDYPCGFLQLEIKNTVSWLGHIAVDAAFRKQGIASSLVNAWINRNANMQNARYQLWVLQNNIPALNLYKQFGFVYANKSTISMIKNK